MSSSTGYVHTVSGNKFNPLSGRVTEVDVLDIAHGLSQVVRYSGQCSSFYSVAEHSLLVLDILKTLYPKDIESQWAGLLHDATEAYICDLPTPIKKLLPQYQEIEANLNSQISEYFEIRWTKQVKERVKEADRIALALEVPHLFEDLEDWYDLVDQYHHLDYIKKEFGTLTPGKVEANFLKAFEEMEEKLELHRDDLG